MIWTLVSAWLRRVGLRVSGWLERRLAVWPRKRVRWVLIALGLLAAAWCGWLLVRGLYDIFSI